jgi:hypothetical protein
MFRFGWRWRKREQDIQGIKLDIEKEERETLHRFSIATYDIIQAIIKNVRENWSVESPSQPYQPPAKDTGNLDTSSYVLNRDATGRFASRDNSTASTLIWDATRGNSYHGRGDYAAAQEFGSVNQEPRPFLAPAMDWATVRYKGLLLRTINARNRGSSY